MKQTLATFTVTPLNGNPAAVKARLAADTEFIATTGEVHPEGDAQHNYVEYALTVDGDGRVFPEMIIDSTTDSTDPNATYTMYLIDSRGKQVGTLFERWMFDASLGANFPFDDLEARNTHRIPLRDDQVYSKMQIDNMFQRRLPQIGTAEMVDGVATITRSTMTARGAVSAAAQTAMSGSLYAEVSDGSFQILSTDGGDNGRIIWQAIDDIS